MKKWKRYVSILLSCLIMVSAIPLDILAEEGGEEFPEDSIVQAYMGDVSGEEEIFTDGEITTVVDADAPIGAGSEEEAVPESDGTEMNQGEDAIGSGEGGEEVFPDNSASEVFGSDASLGLEDDEDLAEMDPDAIQVQEEDEAPSALETIGVYAAPSLSVSTSREYINLHGTKTRKVAVTFSNLSGKGLIMFGTTNSSAYHCSWDSNVSGNTVYLNIEGKSAGSGYVYFYLKSSLWESTLATAKVQVVVHEATVKLSTSSVSVKKGNTASISVSYTGYKGVVLFKYAKEDSKDYSGDYSCSWGSWNGKSIPLKITGKAIGRGTVKIYLYSLSGEKLGRGSISISVTSPEPVVLYNLPTSKSVNEGESIVLKPTYKGYSGTAYMQYSIQNSKVCTASWGKWSGKSSPLTIKGKAVGNTTVTIYLKSIAGVTLASAKVTISVYKKPKITASKTSLNLKTGQSGTITFSVEGVSSYQLQYSTSNTSAYSCSWRSVSNSTRVLIITGKNAGSGSIIMKLKDWSGNVLDSVKISPVTVKKVEPPIVKSSCDAVSMSPGATQDFLITYSNCNEKAYLQYGTTNTSAFSCKWYLGSWSGYSKYLRITGQSKGEGTVVVYLKRCSDDKVLAKTSVSVRVTGGKSSGKYSFYNYSKPSISLKLCKYMYGDNQTARKIYAWDVGAGGVCYGMSTSSGLLNIAKDAPTISSFNGMRLSIRAMNKSDYSSSLQLSLSDFIEAMHISQCSTYTKMIQPSLNDFAKVVREETGKGYPLCVCIRGKEGGHAVTAYDYTETASEMQVKIYDSNAPDQERILYLKKNGSNYTSWSYDISDSIHWGTGKPYADLRYVTYNNLLSVWNKRGRLADGNYNLLCTKEDNFSVYGFNDANGKNDILIAKYENGVLTYQADSVIDVTFDNILPDGSAADVPNMLYLPIDYYKVCDDSPEDGISLSLSNLDLAAEVETDADEFEICASDGNGSEGLGNVAKVMLTPKEGENYKISLGSIRSEEPDEMAVEGVGSGKDELIGASFQDGELSLVGDAASASLSVENFDAVYPINVIGSEYGQIWTESEGEIHEGDTVLYNIKPNDGYLIEEVYIDGEACGPISEYYFTEIQESHSIAASFVKDINACVVTLDQESYIYDGGAKCPNVTVTDPGGEELVLDIDYEVSYMDNIAGQAVCLITALPGSGYGGTAMKEFSISGGNIIVDGIRQVGDELYVDAVNAEPGIVICALYDEQWKMVGISSKKIGEAKKRTEYQFSDLKTADGRGKYAKAFLVDQSFVPLCPSVELVLTNNT